MGGIGASFRTAGRPVKKYTLRVGHPVWISATDPDSENVFQPVAWASMKVTVCAVYDKDDIIYNPNIGGQDDWYNLTQVLKQQHTMYAFKLPKNNRGATVVLVPIQSMSVSSVRVKISD